MGSRATTCVPLPAPEEMCSTPPISSTRSLINCRPKWVTRSTSDGLKADAVVLNNQTDTAFMNPSADTNDRCIRISNSIGESLTNDLICEQLGEWRAVYLFHVEIETC